MKCCAVLLPQAFFFGWLLTYYEGTRFEHFKPESRQSEKMTAAKKGEGSPPPSTTMRGTPFRQPWTPDGHPLVDGKYLDLATGENKTYSGPVIFGPPTIVISWFNKHITGPGSMFTMETTTRAGSVSECIIRIGKLLQTGALVLDSLNATTYSISVIMLTQLSAQEFVNLVAEAGLMSVQERSEQAV
jgi:hypothetical protein